MSAARARRSRERYFMWGRVTQVKSEEKAGRGGPQKLKTPTREVGVSVVSGRANGCASPARVAWESLTSDSEVVVRERSPHQP